jgi:hypothetical protein
MFCILSCYTCSLDYIFGYYPVGVSCLMLSVSRSTFSKFYCLVRNYLIITCIYYNVKIGFSRLFLFNERNNMVYAQGSVVIVEALYPLHLMISHKFGLYLHHEYVYSEVESARGQVNLSSLYTWDNPMLGITFKLPRSLTWQNLFCGFTDFTFS